MLYLLLQKGGNKTLGFFLLQQETTLQHPGFLPATIDKDAPTPWVYAYYNREGCYNTLPRFVVYPSTTLPPWTDFYQFVIHFLDSVIRNHRDKFSPSIIMSINTLMLPAGAFLHHCVISLIMPLQKTSSRDFSHSSILQPS